MTATALSLPSWAGEAVSTLRSRARPFDPGSVARIALSVLSGLLYAAAFPPLEWSACGFLALAPLYLAVSDRRAVVAFGLGWLAGTVACTALVSASVYEAARRYFDSPRWFSALFAVLAPQAYGAPYFGFFAATAASIAKRGWPPVITVLAVAVSWVAWEFVRANLGEGAPWVLLAHSQYARLWLIQIADFSGSFGVSFAVALVGVAIGFASRAILNGPGWRAPTAVAAATSCVMVAIATYGAWQLERWQDETPPFRIGVVQGDIPRSWRTNAARIPASLERMAALTAEVYPSRPDLVVWPENAIGFAAPANADALREVVRRLNPDGALLFGAPRAVQDAPGRASFRNSALLLDDRGEVVATYDKLRLTPFAETAPTGVIPFLHRRFAQRDLYAPGEAPTLFPLGAHRFATLICYEAIYPDLARQFARAGAEFFVNISNDDWFGQRAALAQHLHAALFRAVELRRYLVRATNTGLTAVIDPHGVIAAAAPAAQPAVLVADVSPHRELTFYAAWGDVFAWGCVALAILALVLPGPAFGRRQAPRAG